MSLNLPKLDFKNCMNTFMEERTPNLRYASYDYCFNYFQSFFDSGKLHDLVSTKHIKSSCLHLGFYLASWGMYRGSGWLLKTSVKIFERLLYRIGKLNDSYWVIDVDSYYKDDNIELIMNTAEIIKESFLEINSKYIPSETLITKIMAGVFGSVPAYDNFFNIGLFSKQSQPLNNKSLKFIEQFYNLYKVAIDSEKIHTLDYYTGNLTKFFYSKAKIIDMVCWIEGLNNSRTIKNKLGVKVSNETIKQVKNYIET